MSRKTIRDLTKDRICIIGAGPSGMFSLYELAKLDSDNKPEVVCYEKQSTWGGMWNLTWMTGTDEFGEPCHPSMYKNMWTNSPKECIELKDYTFSEHFGKAMPSFLPREPVRDYLETLWTTKSKDDLRSYIKFNHVVRYVSYDEASDMFHVSVADLKGAKVHEEIFSHVICAVGIFSAPHKPQLSGLQRFHGRIVHAHDFREASEFKGQRVLVVGGSFSAQDISMQCIKYGAKSVVCSWHSKPMNFVWPKNIEERPPIKEVLPKGATFQDGTSAEVDAIILCTGYLYKFPFLEEKLQLVSDTSLYPESLYKGMVWMNGGNNKMFYIGVQKQLYTITMLSIQASWILRFITGCLPNEPKSKAAMNADIEKWAKKSKALADLLEAVDFQADYLEDLQEAVGLDKKHTYAAKEIFHKVVNLQIEKIATYRDVCFASAFSGQMAKKTTPWMENFEEDIDKI